MVDEYLDRFYKLCGEKPGKSRRFFLKRGYKYAKYFIKRNKEPQVILPVSKRLNHDIKEVFENPRIYGPKGTDQDRDMR